MSIVAVYAFQGVRSEKRRNLSEDAPKNLPVSRLRVKLVEQLLSFKQDSIWAH